MCGVPLTDLIDPARPAVPCLVGRLVGRLVTGAALVCLMTACAGDMRPAGGESDGPAALAGSRTSAGPPPPDPSTAAAGPSSTGPASETSAAGVLRSWDEARAAAYATGDVRALRDLYVRGSTAARADVRVLRGYEGRGMRVEGMVTQLLEVEVLAEGPRAMRLRVVERLVGAEAVDVRTGRRAALPRDAASRRVIDLRRERGRWLVAAVAVSP